MIQTRSNRSQATVQGSSTSATYGSLGLKYALRRLSSKDGSRILDLGPAVGRNVQFLSSFASKIHIADIRETLCESPGRTLNDRAKIERALDRDLPRPGRGTVDLVLAWDLLNYLDRDQVIGLGRRLGLLCRRDSLLLAFISNLKKIPEQPNRYLILDLETLRYENDSSRSRETPLYKEPDLERLMPAFEVESSFLLRNGFQEYVVTSRSAPSGKMAETTPIARL